MASRNLCSVAVSVTSLQDELKRKLEPRTASGAARLKTIKTLIEAGIPVTMMVAPVIPMINDSEIEDILEAGGEVGVTSASMIFIRLPREVSPMFRDWLEVHYPQRAEHVMSLIQQSRKGKDYQSDYFQRMSGDGIFAEMIRSRFDVAARKLGINTSDRADLDTSQFKRLHRQLDLF
jgi:DNA repair photolyase